MRYLFLIIFLSISLVNSISAQTSQWVRQIDSEGYDECLDLYTDQSGNIYVTGQMEYTTSFDGYLLEAAGIHDIFVAKYDASGTLAWAKRAGGKDGDKGHSLTVDPSGNVYVIGEFEDTAYFDAIQMVSQGANNMFVAKYDPNGNVLWVRSMGTDSLSTRGYAIACDELGNVYACGATQHNAYYNGTLLYTSNGDYDIILFKFDTNGNYIWSKQIGGNDSDKAYGISVDGPNFYITGYFIGPVVFSPTVTLNGYGRTDFYVAKYDTSGNCQWAVQGGDTSQDRGWDVTVNINGDIVCTGEFNHYGNFGGSTIHSNGNVDMFLAAFDSNGISKWAIKGGGAEDDVGRNVTHDKNGNLYVGGDFGDVATFTPVQLTSNGFADIFLVGYDSSASNTIFAKSYGSSQNDRGRGVGVDTAGNIYFSGEYNDSITFDNISITGNLLLDVFITRLGTTTTCFVAASATGDISCNGICDGIAEVTVTGQAPFTYDWNTSPSQSTEIATGLCGGSYSVLVTDSLGCTGTATVTLTEPSQLFISSSIIGDATCVGCNDGSITVNPIGGTLPYSYSWSNGSTTQTVSNLIVGTYTLCIDDASGCQFCDTFIVDEPNTGVSYADDKSLITFYPNPINDYVTILISKELDINKYLLSIYSVTGVKLKTIRLQNYIDKFSLKEIGTGIYYVKLINKNTNVVQSVISIAIQ
jgi:hypothetical protein